MTHCSFTTSANAYNLEADNLWSSPSQLNASYGESYLDIERNGVKSKAIPEALKVDNMRA